MELTRYDRERLGQIAGAVSLAAHAVPAAVLAFRVLSLPMEAGGLVLGPVLGLPLAVLALVLVSSAVALPTGRTPHLPFAALCLTVLADGILFLNGVATAWAFAGATLSAAALGLFVSTATFSVGPPRPGPRGVGDQAVLIVLIFGCATGLAFVLAGLAG